MSSDRPSPAGGLVALERVLSVVIFLICVVQIYQSTKVGVTPRGTPERAALQQLHISMGLTVLPLILARLWLWRRLPRPARPARIPAAADALARECNLAFYFTVLAFCCSGPFFAWSDGLAARWFGLFTLPALIEPSYRVQVTLGYLHSVLGFWILYLAVFSIGLSIWQAVRYRMPLWRMLPSTGWGK
jgi:cytochrome b561